MTLAPRLEMTDAKLGPRPEGVGTERSGATAKKLGPRPEGVGTERPVRRSLSGAGSVVSAKKWAMIHGR
jgi:hypothetical protein